MLVEIYIFRRDRYNLLSSSHQKPKGKEALLTEKAVYNINGIIPNVNSPQLYDHATRQTRFVSFHLHLSKSSLAAEKIRKSFCCNAGFELFTAVRETTLMIRLRLRCDVIVT